MSKIYSYDIGITLESLRSEIQNLPRDSKIIIYSLNESLDWNDWYHNNLKLKIDLLNEFNFKNKYFIVNDTWNYKNKIDIKVIKINFFAIKTVYESFDKKQDKNIKWNPSSDKSLLLLGKLNSINRIGLFMKLKEENLIKDINYSLKVPQSISILNHVTEIYNNLIHQKICKSTNKSITEFLSENKNDLDDINFINDKSEFWYIGFPYNKDIYSNSSLSIVSETNHELDRETDKPWFTEKTYRAIINKHPFIMINSPKSLNHLKNYGFNTFEEYFKNSNYNDYEYLDGLRFIIENIKDYKLTFSKNINDINKKIEENYLILIQLYNDFVSNEIFSNKKEFVEFMENIPQ